MVTYPSPTSMNYSEGFQVVLEYVNEVSFNWAGNLTLIAIYIITLFGVNNFSKDFSESMAIAGFLTFIVGAFLWISGFVSLPSFIFVIVMAIIGVASLWITKKSSF